MKPSRSSQSQSLSARRGNQVRTISWTATAEEAAGELSCLSSNLSPQGNSSEEYVTKPPKNLGDAFWLKKGTFKTIPISHTGCFTCHNPDSGIAPNSSDCQVCHKLASATVKTTSDFDPSMIKIMGISDRVMLNAWQKRVSAGAYRHEGGMHPDLACTDCHVRTDEYG
jgi:hypothetical protein